MITVTVYIKKDDRTCELVLEELKSLQDQFPHQIAIVDIDADAVIKDRYSDMVPVVDIGPYRLRKKISRMDLQASLGAARDRSEQLEKVGDSRYNQRMKRGRELSSTDRVSFWLADHYMLLINLALFIYVGLPFLAPILFQSGLTGPSKVIYKIYSPLCHQLAFRSFFLYGEQPYYPRELAGVDHVVDYEVFFGSRNIPDIDQARAFIGNEEIGFGVGNAGYKVALCERDIAIYGSLLLFGLIFVVNKRKIQPVPWYIWIAVGLLPIALDGVSQLPGMMTWLPDWVINRESTPALRVLTGFLFGFFTAWYLFPMIEESMRDTRTILASKFAVVPQISQKMEK